MGTYVRVHQGTASQGAKRPKTLWNPESLKNQSGVNVMANDFEKQNIKL